MSRVRKEESVSSSLNNTTTSTINSLKTFPSQSIRIDETQLSAYLNKYNLSSTIVQNNESSDLDKDDVEDNISISDDDYCDENKNNKTLISMMS